MNNIFVLNPKIKECHKVILWYKSEKAQDLFALLTSMGIRIDGFCMEEMNHPSFMGKKVYSVLTMIENGDYALIADIADYDYIYDKYKKYGLDENKIFTWIDERKQILYI